MVDYSAATMKRWGKLLSALGKVASYPRVGCGVPAVELSPTARSQGAVASGSKAAASLLPNLSIERRCPGKSERASQLKYWGVHEGPLEPASRAC